MIASVAALVTFFVLCRLFSGTPDNAGLLASVDPVSAVKGLAFALAFGAGMPATVSMLAAIAALSIAPAAVFLVAHRLARRFDG